MADEELHSLGNRMKEYEKLTTGLRFNQSDIIVARLDGRSFSSFTKSLKRTGPFHQGFTSLMCEITKYLIETHNPIIGYTQSDEITLIFANNNPKSQHPFGGRNFKLTSVLAADASLKFTSLIPTYIPEKSGTLAIFDCRVFTVPSIEEAHNCIKWRRKDGFRNAVSAIAREYFSDKQLHKKSRKDQIRMLSERGVDIFSKYQYHNIDGSIFVRELCLRKLTIEELESLPPKHNARINPNIEFERHEIKELTFDQIRKFLDKRINSILSL